MMKREFKTVKRTKAQSLMTTNAIINFLSREITRTTSIITCSSEMTREEIDEELNNNLKELIRILESFIVKAPEDNYERRLYIYDDEEEG